VMLKVLDDYSIQYIAVKKSRIYNDEKVKHIGGYPKSFVDKLHKCSFAELMFQNDEMIIWKITKV